MTEPADEELLRKVVAYERQIRVMAYMLEQRDAQLRELEFQRLAARVEMEEDEPAPDLEVVSNAEDDGDDEVG